MAYQYDRDYFFDSSKFISRFGYSPVGPGEAIKRVVKDLKALEEKESDN